MHLTVATRRNQCKRRGIEFNLTADDIISPFEKQDGKCALTGVPTTWGAVGKGREMDTLSIDRIHAEGPYVPSNIRLVCHWANVARQRLSDEELYAFCAAVLTHQGAKVAW
jgi:hypothetical protein